MCFLSTAAQYLCNLCHLCMSGECKYAGHDHSSFWCVGLTGCKYRTTLRVIDPFAGAAGGVDDEDGAGGAASGSDGEDGNASDEEARAQRAQRAAAPEEGDGASGRRWRRRGN